MPEPASTDSVTTTTTTQPPVTTTAPTVTTGPTTTTPTSYTAPASQADLDRIVGERLAREREKFADYADLKAKADAHDAALEAAKSDADKAIDAARSEGEKTATERANSMLVRAEARALAAEAKFRNAAVAVAAIDLTGVKVNDDGSVDSDAIKAKLKTLSDSDPYLIDDGKAGKPRPDHSQGGGGQNDAPSVDRGRQMWEEKHGRTAGEKRTAHKAS